MAPLGTVHLVGAGPGDPELVTLKAARLIRSCDALVYDYLVAPELLEWVQPSCRRICVGKRAGFHSLPQEEIQALLISLAREGLEVVRLKGGDPFVFGRGGEELAALAEAGVPAEVVPGITASVGCAAAAGIPLSHRAATGAITFVSGHEMPDKPVTRAIDWRAHARSGATLALYMAMGRLAAITAELIAGGRDAATPAAVVEWGTTPRQRIVRAPLGELAVAVEAAGVGAPAVVFIGEVVDLGVEPF
ncbi:MAG: uroporphyrinogen-III C-methyltransferase [Opitutales bacterium]